MRLKNALIQWTLLCYYALQQTSSEQLHRINVKLLGCTNARLRYKGKAITYHCHGWGSAVLLWRPSCSLPLLCPRYWSCSGAALHPMMTESCCSKPCCTAGSYPHSIAKLWRKYEKKMRKFAAIRLFFSFFLRKQEEKQRWSRKFKNTDIMSPSNTETLSLSDPDLLTIPTRTNLCWLRCSQLW